MKSRNRQYRSLNVSSSRWMAYAVASLATASGGAFSAEGAIHYSGLINFKFDTDSRGRESHSFPLSQGAVLKGLRFVRGAVDNSATLSMKGAAVSSGFRIYSSSSFDPVAAVLPGGAVVSQGYFNNFGLAFLQDYECDFPGWLAPGTYYVGFRFNSGAGRQYGWVRIKWGGCSVNNSANKYIVKDYAWGDPGDQIKAGQKKLHENEAQVVSPAKSADAAPPVDSQGSLGLLALGAVALKAWRAKRAE